MKAKARADENETERQARLENQRAVQKPLNDKRKAKQTEEQLPSWTMTRFMPTRGSTL